MAQFKSETAIETCSTRARRGRILCVTSNFPRWQGDSVTPFVLRLAQDLITDGWDIDILAPHAPQAALKETIEGVPTERFRYLWPDSWQTVCYQGGALVNLRKNRRNYLKVPLLVGCESLAVIRRVFLRQYDLIHAHWILPQGFTCAFASKLCRKPLVVTAHGGDVFALQGKFLAKFKSAALRSANAVTTNSNLTREAVLKLCPDIQHIQRIPASPAEGVVDTASAHTLREKYRGDSGPLLIFLGRLVEEKGIGDLLAAVQLIRHEFPSLRLLVVGDGQDKERFVQQSHSLGLAECVTFAGWIDQSVVPTYLAAADIFVGPSRTAVDGWIEAQGLTFVEAMLANTPVIATGVGGIVESIKHGETGLIVDERRPDQIADAIRKIVEAPSLAEALAKKARAFAVENLSRRYAAQAYSKLFEELIHGPHVSQPRADPSANKQETVNQPAAVLTDV